MSNTEVLSAPKFKPSHPGAVFKRQVLGGNNLTVTEAAERLGITRKHLSNFCNEHASCSIDLAQRIAAATGSDVAMWINLQAHYIPGRQSIRAAPSKGHWLNLPFVKHTNKT